MGRYRKALVGGAALLLGGLAFTLAPNASAEVQQDAPRPEAGVQTIGETEAAHVDLAYAGPSVQRMSYPGATFVKVHFDKMMLADGDWVEVSGKGESYRYDNASGAGAWATSVTGDTATLTLHRAHKAAASVLGDLSAFGATVDKVSRGLTPAEVAERNRAPESVCDKDDKRDAVCYRETDPKAYESSQAVARLLINGTTLCTAWRIGPNNRMITNHHCFTTSDEAKSTEVWFGYECAICGAGAAVPAEKVRGDDVLATDQTYDYTLFTLDDFDKVKDFGYLELDDRVADKGEKLYIPQHPSGKPLEIAVDSDVENGYCRVEEPKFQGYEADTDVGYRCDTEFGSSGSPVIARSTNKVIALHHFGGCPNSGVRADLLMREIGRLL